MIPIVIDEHLFGPEMTGTTTDWRAGPEPRESTWRRF
jgi:hypothetical protein